MTRRRHRRSTESERLVGEVRSWAERVGVAPKRVYVQPMKKKWASCAPGGRVYFSSDLVQETSGFRDVVIVHELLHLRIGNHGKLFKSLMGAFVPDWEQKGEGRIRKVCR